MRAFLSTMNTSYGKTGDYVYYHLYSGANSYIRILTNFVRFERNYTQLSSVVQDTIFKI